MRILADRKLTLNGKGFVFVADISVSSAGYSTKDKLKNYCSAFIRPAAMTQNHLLRSPYSMSKISSSSMRSKWLLLMVAIGK